MFELLLPSDEHKLDLTESQTLMPNKDGTKVTFKNVVEGRKISTVRAIVMEHDIMKLDK